MSDRLSEANAEFWDEVCGSNLAKSLGVHDSQPQSLKRFDDWYFAFYPYLCDCLDRVVERPGSVLEIGLGYGSVGTFLLSRGMTYAGVDIASGPVDLMNLRASHLGLSEPVAFLGDALALEMFEQDIFDSVIAIGSLHHTGDFDLALQEAARVAKPGGTLVGMVYSLFSLRNWLRRPLVMFKALLRNRLTAGARICADENLRWMSDHNSSGVAAPATEYFSRRALRKALEPFGDVSIRARNLDTFVSTEANKFFPWLRLFLLKTPLAYLVGLDLYFTLELRGEDGARAAGQPADSGKR